jgi:predicted enzyme related to lactoylglutathione lyase
MATLTQHAPGTFSWPELYTGDQNASKQFYATLFGWTFKDTPMGPGAVYTIFQLGGRDVAAAFQITSEMEAQGLVPNWMSYVTVDDADATVAQAKQLGAKVMIEPRDVQALGRMAWIQDPTGAHLCVWQPKSHAGVGVLDEVGALGWTELMTPDPGKAGPFYAQIFGWKTEDVPAMEYTLFKRGDTHAAGMKGITAQMGPIPPHWMPYFLVDDCDRAAQRTKEMGGAAVFGPQDVPGMGRFAVLRDPQGAHFSVLARADAM